MTGWAGYGNAMSSATTYWLVHSYVEVDGLLIARQFRAIEPLLAKYSRSRVIWISSHEGTSEYYVPKDYQLIKNDHSYQCSKYQMTLMALCLDQEASKTRGPGIRHIAVLPGVAGTNIANALLGPITFYIMYLTFYLVSYSILYHGCHINTIFCRLDSWGRRTIPYALSRQPSLQCTWHSFHSPFRT